ncbi:NADH-ubiquinone oxidoreductase chain 5 [Armadillidium vulgare]|nr:NADH-ubiquinone oxidoreductase chain 5 [Armadillidium vulgare]
MNNYYCSDAKWKNKMKREKSGRTYPKNAVAIEIRRIVTPTNQLLFLASVLYFRGRLNLVRIILGWDGLGIISYILVVFYNNEKSNRAGILTVIRNRIGFGKLAFIHLLTHAVFKALLFICRGKVIHNVGDYQDARKIGGEIFNLPITRAIIVLSRYALCEIFMVIWNLPILRGIKFGFSSIRSYLSLVKLDLGLIFIELVKLKVEFYEGL